MKNENSKNLIDCDYCYYCNYCNYCYYSKGLRMSEFMIFCLGKGKYERQGIGYQKNHKAFNKDITEDRYKEILKQTKEILKDLKLELKDNNWKDEWKKITPEQWKQLSEIPEFDKEVVEGIIGFELNLNKVEPYSKETIENAKRILKDVGEL